MKLCVLELCIRNELQIIIYLITFFNDRSFRVCFLVFIFY